MKGLSRAEVQVAVLRDEEGGLMPRKGQEGKKAKTAATDAEGKGKRKEVFVGWKRPLTREMTGKMNHYQKKELREWKPS